MSGKIIFTELEDLIEFLAMWAGKSTAVFEVRKTGQSKWEMVFSGGF